MCFCDIPLSKVDARMGLYGKCGVVLNKGRCLSRDVRPITCLNTSGRLTKDVSSAFNRLPDSSERVDETWRFLPDMALSTLPYCKPIGGPMRRGSKMLENQPFIDEREWRYVPKVPDGMPLFMDSRDGTPEGVTAHSV